MIAKSVLQQSYLIVLVITRRKVKGKSNVDLYSAYT